MSLKEVELCISIKFNIAEQDLSHIYSIQLMKGRPVTRIKGLWSFQESNNLLLSNFGSKKTLLKTNNKRRHSY